MHNGSEIHIQDINQKPEGRDHLGDLGVDRRIRIINGTRERGCGLNSADRVQNLAVSSCEHSSEPVGSIKGGEMFWPSK